MFYGVHRSTITRAVGEIKPLLAARGFAVPDKPGLRLKTLRTGGIEDLLRRSPATSNSIRRAMSLTISSPR